MKKGFNITELILVIAGVALLSSIIIDNITNVKQKATFTAVQMNINEIQTAVDRYKIEHSELPIIPSEWSNKEGDVKFDLLTTEYIRSKPKTEQFDYYINSKGKVYATEKGLGNKIKSGNLHFSEMKDLEKIKRDISQMDLNTVNVPIRIDFENEFDMNMKINNESKQDAIAVIQMLNSMGVKVILEPYPLIAHGTISETQYNPPDINTFFWNWKTNILKEMIEDVAQPYQVFAVNSSSNLVNLEYAEGYWRNVFSYMRSLYPEGKVTYRTNWWLTATWDTQTQQQYQNKLNNPLFGDVDFISISAYFELTNQTVHSSNDVSTYLLQTERYDRQQNIYQEVKNFADKWNKPIFFGELGFPHQDHAFSEPWNYSPNATVNEKIQSYGFDGYKHVFEKESWFMGFSVFSIGYQSEYTPFYPTETSKQSIKQFFKRYY